jgi:hypothetical protein
MRRTWGIKASTLAVLLLLGGAAVSLAAVPPPPVNQILGTIDTEFNALTEADCRVCHSSGLPDRHHVLYGTAIPEGVCNTQQFVCQNDVECQQDTCNTQTGFCVNQPSITCTANGDADCQTDYCIRDSVAPNAPPPPSGNYECLSCHTLEYNPVTMSYEFEPFRDCLQCHFNELRPGSTSPQEPTVHHRGPTAAVNLDCVACHGSLVNGVFDDHYIPTYAPSLVTPWPSGKVDGGPNGEGNCNFCHNEGTEGGIPILDNHDNHHGTGLTRITLSSPPFPNTRACYLCHNPECGRPCHDAFDIRTCERCHGPDSLHNIQVDTGGDGIVPGGELAYYGHIGNNDDCFGCHGFTAPASVAPYSGPVVPYVDGANVSVMTAGTGADVTLTGVAFTNFVEGQELVSNAALTAPDGSTTSLAPASVTESEMVVSVPGTSKAGKYVLRATKGSKVSNPAVIAVKPRVVINSANCSGGTVSVTGSGFSGYADATDSGTSITSVIGGASEKGSIVSWTDKQIVADFSQCGDAVEVSSVFGSATALLNPAGACTSSVVGAGTESTSKSAGGLYILLLPLAALIFLKIRRGSK